MSDAMTMINQATGAAPVVVNGDEIRGQTRSRDFTVTREQLAAYAATTGDTRPERLAGDFAVPAYGFVPLTPLLFDVVDEVAGEDRSATGVVHTHQSFTIHEPIRAGDELSVLAHVVDLRSGPVGAVVKVAATSTRADGVVVNEQLVTALVVGATCENPILDPAHDPAETVPSVGKPPAGTSAIVIEKDHPARYAEASGDTNPIHLDPAYARSAGFPGCILHGMCTMAMAGNLIEATYPQFPSATSFGVEFARPVFPGDRLTARWDETPTDDGVSITFEVLNRKQRMVMRGGFLTLT